MYACICRHNPGRRFFVSAIYNGCPNDSFYTVTITPSQFSCTFDAPTSFPQFMYSRLNTYAVGVSSGMRVYTIDVFSLNKAMFIHAVCYTFKYEYRLIMLAFFVNLYPSSVKNTCKPRVVSLKSLHW